MTMGGGGSHIDMVYGAYNMCLPFGHFFTKFGIVIGGFSSETREPKLYKTGCILGQIIVKSTQFGQNWVLSFENGILMGGKLGKKIV